MKQVLIKQGQAVVSEALAPSIEAGMVLVRLDHSCISAGTELDGMLASGQPLWKRALEQPERVRQVVDLLGKQGLSTTRKMVKRKVFQEIPTGYSAAGKIIEIGDGISDLSVGQRVACAGNQYAFHAEIIRVPRNLVVPLPIGLAFEAASTVTLGAIALQGVRRLTPTLGETFTVIGLGILGQLTAQILRANGCRVIGLDTDAGRSQLAVDSGMDCAIDTGDVNAVKAALRLTGGVGTDGVIVTAATPSDEVISTAFQMCRRKGRVVLVGDVGLDLQRADIYAKELDFLVSTSYGPGRYDASYEEDGHDYPIGYVRWTENRNMVAYLDLLKTKRIDIAPLISSIFPLEKAPEAFRLLESRDQRPMIVLISYPKTPDALIRRRIDFTTKKPLSTGKIRLAVVGAGNFVKNLHLPNLEKLHDYYQLRAIMSRSGHNATSTAKQFSANYATTDYTEILGDTDIDAVLIGTPHNIHGKMVLAALEAGKHVLVEKPLAVNQSELDAIAAFYEGRSLAETPTLLTGFNRRFSSHVRKVAEILTKRSNPAILNYRMNAGYISGDHWAHGPRGGGRNIGEACHIYDLFTYLTGSRVVDISVKSIQPTTGFYRADDNFVATLTFDCGSIATLTYTALGDSSYPKERMDVFCDGRVFELDDYQALAIYGSKFEKKPLKINDKGHIEELRAFADAITVGGEWPIPLWQQLQAMEISFSIEFYLTQGGSPTNKEK
jgi:predicted dehydrogenase/threonine dehydrogenase-like Zn-dependent dehydrogenase